MKVSYVSLCTKEALYPNDTRKEIMPEKVCTGAQLADSTDKYHGQLQYFMSEIGWATSSSACGFIISQIHHIPDSSVLLRTSSIALVKSWYL